MWAANGFTWHGDHNSHYGDQCINVQPECSCAYILAIVHRGASYSPTGLSLISFLDFCDDHLSIQITDRHGTAMYYIDADMIMIVTNIIVTLHLSVDGFTQQME